MIIKHATIGREELTDHMRAYAEKYNLLSAPQDMLISSYFTTKQFFSTEYLR